jgi:hypothetical protein
MRPSLQSLSSLVPQLVWAEAGSETANMAATEARMIIT